VDENNNGSAPAPLVRTTPAPFFVQFLGRCVCKGRDLRRPWRGGRFFEDDLGGIIAVGATRRKAGALRGRLRKANVARARTMTWLDHGVSGWLSMTRPSREQGPAIQLNPHMAAAIWKHDAGENTCPNWPSRRPSKASPGMERDYFGLGQARNQGAPIC